VRPRRFLVGGVAAEAARAPIGPPHSREAAAIGTGVVNVARGEETDSEEMNAMQFALKRIK